MKTSSKNTLLVQSISVLEVLRIFFKHRISIFYNFSADSEVGAPASTSLPVVIILATLLYDQFEHDQILATFK